jgi:hypothetical protein
VPLHVLMDHEGHTVAGPSFRMRFIQLFFFHERYTPIFLLGEGLGNQEGHYKGIG